MAKPQLTPQNATVTTATVQIKTLTMAGKQVTQAVFRQLRNEELIAEDSTLNGDPWGIVNYHPDKCDGGRPHWHIVWQKAEDLLRAQVPMHPVFEREIRLTEGDRLLTALARDWLKNPTEERPSYLHVRYRGGGWQKAPITVKFTEQDSDPLIVVAEAHEAVMPATEAFEAVQSAQQEVDYAAQNAPEPLGTPPWMSDETPPGPAPASGAAKILADRKAGRLANAQARLASAQTAFAEVLETLDAIIEEWADSTSALQTEYLRAVNDVREAREQRRELHESLSQLPQLFIAV